MIVFLNSCQNTVPFLSFADGKFNYERAKKSSRLANAVFTGRYAISGFTVLYIVSVLCPGL